MIEADTNELLAEADMILYNVMHGYLHKGEYDYLHKGLGMGLYFLRRAKKNPELKGYLSNVVLLLERHSIKETDNGIIKWQSINFTSQMPEFNFGLSHGIPSILVFLVLTYKQGIEVALCEKLIKGTVNFLLSSMLDPAKHGCYFQYRLFEEDEVHLQPSRLAWCYGDLGVCCALWQAADLLDDSTLKEKVIEILLFDAQRRDLQANMVFDAGLCHGAAGIAHIYKRMYQRTKIEVFNETANYWYEQTLAMARFEDGLAGYKTYTPHLETKWQNITGFLEGIAGIGLSLLGAVSDMDTDWDECLLI